MLHLKRRRDDGDRIGNYLTRSFLPAAASRAQAQVAVMASLTKSDKDFEAVFFMTAAR
jgi:hypothetical protein